MTLADARALMPQLDVAAGRAGDADRGAAPSLAAWCTRYTPSWRHRERGRGRRRGLWLDITGCAHLFGGEAALLERLDRQDRAARLHGARRHRRHARRRLGLGALNAGAICDRPSSHRAERGARRPAGRRLAHRRPRPSRRCPSLGPHRIGDLYALPRAAAWPRASAACCCSGLEQALGDERRAASPRPPPAVFRATLNFAEPIASRHGIAAAVDLAAPRSAASGSCARLEREGGRRLRAGSLRSDGDDRRTSRSAPAGRAAMRDCI